MDGRADLVGVEAGHIACGIDAWDIRLLLGINRDVPMRAELDSESVDQFRLRRLPLDGEELVQLDRAATVGPDLTEETSLSMDSADLIVDQWDTGRFEPLLEPLVDVAFGWSWSARSACP